MKTEILHVQRNYLHQVPEAHRSSVDTRLRWLWNQKFGHIQTIHNSSPDPLDKMACVMIIQALFASDLNAITLILRRLEGGSVTDDQVAEQSAMRV